MGEMQHAMMGTAAVAIGTAAPIPGILVNLAAGGANAQPCASATHQGLYALVQWLWRGTADGRQVEKAQLSRSARVLMDGHIHVPSAMHGGAPGAAE